MQVTIILLCFTLNMLDGFDVLAISFTAPSIVEEWSIRPEALGIVFSAGLVGMTLGAMFIAPVTDLIGRRAMVLLSLFVISIAMALTGIRTTGVGWAIGAGRTGAIVGPFLGGVLIGLDWPVSAFFIVFALPLVVAAVAARAIPSPAI